MMEKLVSFYRSKVEKNQIVEISGYGDALQPYAEEVEGNTPIPCFERIPSLCIIFSG